MSFTPSQIKRGAIESNDTVITCDEPSAESPKIALIGVKTTISINIAETATAPNSHLFLNKPILNSELFERALND